MSYKKEFKIEEVADNPEDLENSNFKIPDEISEKMGLKPGDPIKVYLGDQGSVIVEKLEESEGEDQKNE